MDKRRVIFEKKTEMATSCKASIILQNIAAVPTATVSNGELTKYLHRPLLLNDAFAGIILLRVTSLWNKQRMILYSTFAVLAVTTIITFVLLCGFHLSKILSK
jgi:hypothetical protein